MIFKTLVKTQVADRMWRKNRAPIVSERGCVGVDLNRNFPIGHRTGMGTKKVQVFLKEIHQYYY